MGQVQLLLLLGHHDHGHRGVWRHYSTEPGGDGVYKHYDVPLKLHVRLFYELHWDDSEERVRLQTIFQVMTLSIPLDAPLF